MEHFADKFDLVLAALPSAPAFHPADDELVTASRSGDQAAFAQLFERYRRLVTRQACRFFHRREQVEEIVQESFTDAYFALGSYQGGRERSFAAWLSRITVRVCYDELKRERRRTAHVVNQVSEEEEAYLNTRIRDESPASRIENAVVARDLVGKLLAHLNPADRLVLTLLNVEDLSIAEIADLTGWSASKVKMRAHRARAALRRALNKLL